MEMNVRDDQKLVEIWLTNAEKSFARQVMCFVVMNR